MRNSKVICVYMLVDTAEWIQEQLLKLKDQEDIMDKVYRRTVMESIDKAKEKLYAKNDE